MMANCSLVAVTSAVTLLKLVNMKLIFKCYMLYMIDAERKLGLNL